VLLRQKTEGPDQLGRHPETGELIYIKIGTYGPYVQLGKTLTRIPNPSGASLPKGVNKVSLDMAVGLCLYP